MALPNPNNAVSPFDIGTSEWANNVKANIDALSDGTGIDDSAVTAAKIDFTTFPISSAVDANGWTVTNYGNFKMATKTVTPASVSKVRFEVTSQSSINLPVGIATAAALKTMSGEIGLGTFSDYVSITRNTTSGTDTALYYSYMYLGPTSVSSYTVPIQFTVIW